MELYVAEGHINYEGLTILGVFDSMEMAEEECKKQGAENHYDFFEVNKYELNDGIV